MLKGPTYTRFKPDFIKSMYYSPVYPLAPSAPPAPLASPAPSPALTFLFLPYSTSTSPTQDSMAYFEKIRPIGEQYGICKVTRPSEGLPPVQFVTCGRFVTGVVSSPLVTYQLSPDTVGHQL